MPETAQGVTHLLTYRWEEQTASVTAGPFRPMQRAVLSAGSSAVPRDVEPFPTLPTRTRLGACLPRDV